MSRLRLPACALCLLLPALVHAGEGHGGSSTSGDVTLVYNSNVTNAEMKDDIADDYSLEGELSYTYSTPSLAGHSFHWTVSALGAKFDQFTNLDRAELKVEGAYDVQFTRGFSAPVYEFSASVKAIDSASVIRDGWQVELGAMATSELTDRVTARAGLRLTRREATDYDVFDLKRGNVFVNADWLKSSRSVFYGTYIFSRGDVVSTAVPTLKIIDAAQVIEPDDAFGGVPANRFAYRLNADVNILTFGYNRAVGAQGAIDVSVESLFADADGGNQYQRTITRIAYLRRF